jgi:hypothetical protein
MGFFNNLFKKKKTNPIRGLVNDFVVTITDHGIKVEHPRRKTEQVSWRNIKEIKFINTSTGPILPDIWLAVMGDEDGCLIPQGAKGFDSVYDIVSKYEGFDFDNVTNSMRCTDDAEFILWQKSI